MFKDKPELESHHHVGLACLHQNVRDQVHSLIQTRFTYYFMARGKTRGKGKQQAKPAASNASAPSKPAAASNGRSAKPGKLPSELREDADGVYDSDPDSLGERENLDEDSADEEEAVMDLEGDESDEDSDADLEPGGQLSKGAAASSAKSLLHEKQAAQLRQAYTAAAPASAARNRSHCTSCLPPLRRCTLCSLCRRIMHHDDRCTHAEHR